MLFTAYSQVTWELHATYNEYASLDPLTHEAALIARGLQRPADGITEELNETLRNIKNEATEIDNNGVEYEFSLFAVLTPDGEGYNIYFLDEDSLVINIQAGVKSDGVITAATQMLNTVKENGWRGKRRRPARN